jgi:Mrp family chromosome partitioning ATPase
MREKEEAVRAQMARIPYKILVMSGKGGVGKSSIAVQIALSLCPAKSVAILDLDLHAPSIPSMVGLEGMRFQVREGKIQPLLHPCGLKVVSIGALLPEGREVSVSWRGPLKAAFIRRLLGDLEWGELDVLVMDSPPGTGDEPLTVSRLIPDAQAVLVTTPQEISLIDVAKAVAFCRKAGIKILGIVENMSGFRCPHCGALTEIFKSGGGSRLAESLGVTFLGSIPLEPALAEAMDRGDPMSLQNTTSELFSREFSGFLDRLCKVLGMTR